MEIILKKDIDNLGQSDDLVKVKDGYGRNYLIPNGMAVLATSSQKKMREERLKYAEQKRAQILEKIKANMDKIKNAKLKVGAKVGTSGKIFGSVTNIQLAEALKSQIGIDVDRKNIKIPDDVKMLGSYVASLDMGNELQVDINFEVVGE